MKKAAPLGFAKFWPRRSHSPRKDNGRRLGFGRYTVLPRKLLDEGLWKGPPSAAC
jgi:hypothetical protein